MASLEHPRCFVLGNDHDLFQLSFKLVSRLHQDDYFVEVNFNQY